MSPLSLRKAALANAPDRARSVVAKRHKLTAAAIGEIVARGEAEDGSAARRGAAAAKSAAKASIKARAQSNMAEAFKPPPPPVNLSGISASDRSAALRAMGVRAAPAVEAGSAEGRSAVLRAMGHEQLAPAEGPSTSLPAAPRPASPAPGGPVMLLAVADFFREHPEFGKPLRSREVPPWFKGKREAIETVGGRSLLFYEKEGKVVTVYENDPARGRTILWGAVEKD
jgi:hypothetical protein